MPVLAARQEPLTVDMDRATLTDMDTEQQIFNDLDGYIRLGDLDRVMDTELMIDWATLPEARWMVLRRRIKERFAKTVQMGELDRLIKEARTRIREKGIPALGMKPMAPVVAEVERPLPELPAAEGEIVAEVGRVMAAGDLAAVWAMVPRLAQLEVGTWWVMRERLRRKFAGGLPVRDLDRAVRLARMAPVAMAADEDQEQSWRYMLQDLYRVYSFDWFGARQVAAAVRDGKVNLPASLARIDRERAGSLERAVGRYLTRRVDRERAAPVRTITRKLDAHTRLYRWRLAQVPRKEGTR